MPLNEMQKIYALAAELQQRGIPIPEDISDALLGKKKVRKVPLTPLGYFYKSNHLAYVPNDKIKPFMESTAVFKGLFAGRGCLSSDTIINGQTVGDLSRESLLVLDTFSGKVVTPPFYLKGLDDLYTLQTNSGRLVKATLSHRILSPSGWIQLNQARPGSLVLIDGSEHGLLPFQKSTDLLDNYSLGFHLHDELLHLSSRASLSILLQSRNKVSCNSASFVYDLLSIVGFYGRLLYLLSFLHHFYSTKLEHTQHQLEIVLQSLYNYILFDINQPIPVLEGCISELYDLSRILQSSFSGRLLHNTLRFVNLLQSVQGSGLFLPSELSYYVVDSDGLSNELPYHLQFCLDHIYFDFSKTNVPLQVMGNQIPVINDYYRPHLKSLFQLLADYILPVGDLVSIHKNEELPLYQQFCIQESLKSLKPSYRYYEVEEWLHNLKLLDDLSCTNLLNFYDLLHYTTDYECIKSVEYSGFGEFYDVTVPQVHNYLASGFYHHNSGKSSAGAQCALRKLLVEEQSGAVINPSFENFKISTWPEFREWIPWDLVIRGQQHRQFEGWEPSGPFDMVFDLGSKRVVAHCKGIRDPNSARGPNINWLWYDEAREDTDGTAWKFATAGVRIGPNPQSWVTTTPAGQDHWMYKFFVEKDIPEEAIKLILEASPGRNLVDVFFTTIFDNAANLAPEFVAAMITMYKGGWLYRQEILGEFVAGDGSIGVEAADGIKANRMTDMPTEFYRAVRFWDLAGTEKKIIKGKAVNDPDETVGSLGLDDKNTVFIVDQVAGCWNWDKVKETILETAKKDGPGVVQVFEQEPASGGKNQVAELRSFLKTELNKAFPDETWPMAQSLLPRELGDRVMAANTWFSKCYDTELGPVGIKVVDNGIWDCEGFIQQVSNFPITKHDDKVTSVSGVWHILRPNKPLWKKVGFLRL